MLMVLKSGMMVVGFFCGVVTHCSEGSGSDDNSDIGGNCSENDDSGVAIALTMMIMVW